MEGRGVTNYSSNPSHGYTTNTTEFDDELMKRKIITFEQAMLAKGCSAEEAKRLVQLKQQQEASKNQTSISQPLTDTKKNSTQEKESEAIDEFRSRRLLQLQHGNVIPISRPEWNKEVNDASHSQWVVILLTCNASAPNMNPYHHEICLKIEQDIVPCLASKYSEVKWVRIPSKSAIENWPDDNLPTIFCYRYGQLKKQLVGLQEFGAINVDSLDYKLGKLGVVESDVEIDPDCLEKQNNVQNRRNMETSTYGRSKFQGGMATFATSNDNDDDLSDYDDVD